MTNVQHIQTFMFDFAKYQLQDQAGSVVILEINYAHNSHRVRLVSNKADKNFLLEVHRVAVNLLARKHNVNFVDKVTI